MVSSHMASALGLFRPNRPRALSPQQKCPGKSYVFLEGPARPSVGGTWDLFRLSRYPFSDSRQLFHAGLFFQGPWVEGQRRPIATGAAGNFEPIRDVAGEPAGPTQGIAKEIRFKPPVKRASWFVPGMARTGTVEARAADRRWRHGNRALFSLPISCSWLRALRNKHNEEKALHAGDFSGSKQFRPARIVPSAEWTTTNRTTGAGKRVVV